MFGLGTANLLKGQLHSAKAHLQKASANMPTDIGTLHALAWCHVLGGDLDEAHATFAGALALDPDWGESHGGMAVVDAMRGQADDAQASIERALRLDPECVPALYAQAILSGEAADPARLQAWAHRLFGKRFGP